MTTDARNLERWSPWLFAILSLAPLAWCWTSFTDLFWFGDDWDQLDQIWQGGLWHWVSYAFAESYAPVWKATWGAMVFMSGGSYLVMILFNWLLHALNVALFGLWLRRSGFGTLELAITLVGFGLATANIETLGWSVQVSMIMAQTFFFAAAWWFDRQEEGAERWRWPALLLLFVFIAGSALSFARGVLTGLTLGLMVVLGPLVTHRRPTGGRPQRAVLFCTCLLPAIVVAYVISRYAGGNQHRLLGNESVLGPALDFGTCYFLSSPFFAFFDVNSWGWRTVAFLGTIKVVLLVGGWRHATPTQRNVLLNLLVLDLGTAALLGLGRYHTGTYAVTSSRYQYVALCCTMPFVAVHLAHLLKRMPGSAHWRTAWRVAAVSGVLWFVAHKWPRAMDDWAGWRGRDARRIVFTDPNPPAEGAIPGIPMLSTGRAKELVEHYHLH